ncbi:unnamed protein product, partial [Heterosigma akashiwo]
QTCCHQCVQLQQHPSGRAFGESQLSTLIKGEGGDQAKSMNQLTILRLAQRRRRRRCLRTTTTSVGGGPPTSRRGP